MSVPSELRGSGVHYSIEEVFLSTTSNLDTSDTLRYAYSHNQICVCDSCCQQNASANLPNRQFTCEPSHRPTLGESTRNSDSLAMHCHPADSMKRTEDAICEMVIHRLGDALQLYFRFDLSCFCHRVGWNISSASLLTVLFGTSAVLAFGAIPPVSWIIINSWTASCNSWRLWDFENVSMPRICRGYEEFK